MCLTEKLFIAKSDPKTLLINDWKLLGYVAIVLRTHCDVYANCLNIEELVYFMFRVTVSHKTYIFFSIMALSCSDWHEY